MLRFDENFLTDIIHGIQGMTSNPKVFISYTWTSEEHKEWVRDLADELIANGVDVILDQYDLREGDDINHFMEKSIADRSIDRVIVISDKKYTEKANNREGGSGYEAGIISLGIAKKIESKIGGNKICPIVVELNDNGEYCLPTYLDGHNAINMIEDYRHTNFEQLLRWIYNKQKLVKPKLGIRPTFLDEKNHGIQLYTRGEALNARMAIEHGKPNALSALDQYLKKLESGLSLFENKEATSDKMLVKIKEQFADFNPYKNEFLEVIKSICQTERQTRLYDRVRFFFEVSFPWRLGNSSGNIRFQSQFAHYDLFLYEIFISTIALCLKYEAFSFSKSLLKMDYALKIDPGSSQYSLCSFEYFTPTFDHLSALFNENGVDSVRETGRLIIERTAGTGLTKADIVTADLYLKIVSSTKELSETKQNHLWRKNWDLLIANLNPNTLTGLPFFIRCVSKEYLDKVVDGAGINADLFRAGVEKLSSRTRNTFPWEWATKYTQWSTRP